jgi:3-deoxy-D-manno-octulosonate 8-phosphate phosphatase KdsC-like HAD superfamily phosphatase
VIWRDRQGHEVRAIEVYDGTRIEVESDAGDRQAICRRFAKQTQARIEQVNTELESGNYHALTQPDAFFAEVELRQAHARQLVY